MNKKRKSYLDLLGGSDEKLYFKTVRVQHFSKDERKNCKGKKVIVNYSYKEPSYSHVNLGEYEYKKRTFYLLNSF